MQDHGTTISWKIFGRKSPVGMVTSDGTTDYSWFDYRQGLRIFLISSTSRLTLDVTQLLFSRYRVTLLGEWCGWGVNLTAICKWCRVYVSVKLYPGVILWRRTWFLVCGLIFVGLAVTETVSSLSVTAGHAMWRLWFSKYSGRLGLSPSTLAFLCQYNSTDTPYLSPSLYCL